MRSIIFSPLRAAVGEFDGLFIFYFLKYELPDTGARQRSKMCAVKSKYCLLLVHYCELAYLLSLSNQSEGVICLLLQPCHLTVNVSETVQHLN